MKDNKELWTQSSKAADAYNSILSKVIDTVAAFYKSLQNVGTEITSALIDNLVNGFSDEDFIYAMQKYIQKAVIQAVVFTQTFMAQVAAIGQEIANGIASGFSEDQLTALRERLAALYTSAAASAATASALVESVFGSYDVGTLNVSGDQIARIHNSEMILNPGLAEEARRAGVFIGPADSLSNVGRAAAMTGTSINLRLSLDGTITADGRAIGQLAYEYQDKVIGAAYGG